MNPSPAPATSDLSPGARVGVGVVACAAAVLSFSSLANLAWSTGYTASVMGLFYVAWLLPVALDAAAGVSTFVWLRARRPEVVALSRRLAWATIGLSVVGNGTEHALQAMGERPHWLIAVAVGAVAPAVFGAVVHLAVVATSTPVTEQSVTEQAGTVKALEGWGGPETVTGPPTQPITVPAPVTLPTATPALARPRSNVTPAAPPSAPATASSPSTSPSVVHVQGWRTGMEAVAREDGQPAAVWLCARARVLGVKQTAPNGNRRPNPELRRDVEVAELERARGREGVAV